MDLTVWYYKSLELVQRRAMKYHLSDSLHQKTKRKSGDDDRDKCRRLFLESQQLLRWTAAANSESISPGYVCHSSIHHDSGHRVTHRHRRRDFTSVCCPRRDWEQPAPGPVVEWSHWQWGPRQKEIQKYVLSVYNLCLQCSVRMMRVRSSQYIYISLLHLPQAQEIWRVLVLWLLLLRLGQECLWAAAQVQKETQEPTRGLQRWPSPWSVLGGVKDHFAFLPALLHWAFQSLSTSFLWKKNSIKKHVLLTSHPFHHEPQ